MGEETFVFCNSSKVCHKFVSDMSPFQFIVDKTVHEESDAKENWTLFFQTSAIITHCLCYFNSAINPIIYYFMSAQFKVKPFCLKTVELFSLKIDGFPPSSFCCNCSSLLVGQYIIIIVLCLISVISDFLSASSGCSRFYIFVF